MLKLHSSYYVSSGYYRNVTELTEDNASANLATENLPCKPLATSDYSFWLCEKEGQQTHN